jgi:hypothetical protein
MIGQLWATPFMRTKAPADLIEEVATNILLEYDITNMPEQFGSVNVLESENPVLQRFKNELVYPTFNTFLQETLNKSIEDWGGHRMKGWVASYNNSGLAYHNHRGSQLSAVFYVMCEETDMGGEITFTDPRQNSNRGYDESFMPWFEHLSLVPKTGDVVVFPSFLYHYVSTYKSNIRLAIPVDLFLHTNK